MPIIRNKKNILPKKKNLKNRLVHKHKQNTLRVMCSGKKVRSRARKIWNRVVRMGKKMRGGFDRLHIVYVIRSWLYKRSELRYSKNYLQLFGTVLFTAGVVFGITFGGYKLIKRIFALTESTVSMPGEVAFDRGTVSGLAGYSDGGGVVSVLSSEVRIATSSSWWDGNYLQKKPFTLKNLSTQSLPASGSASITINTKELYDAGKLQTDCDDLRVVYIATESANVRRELPRSILIASEATDCSDSTSTIVTFPRQDMLWPSGGTDVNYELYYGNASAASPASGALGYDISRADGSTASATLVCPFNGTTTCVDGETPTVETGVIRYSGGKSAMSFDGNDYVRNSSATIDFASNEVTVELWVKLSDSNFGGYPIFMQSNNFWLGTDRTNNCSHSNNFVFGISNVNTCDQLVHSTSSVTSKIGQWVHVAGIYNGSELRIYIDGELEATKAYTKTIGNSTNYYLGHAEPTYRPEGIFDELRVSNTVRYTENFTPQTAPFSPDSNTKLLLHFDENGDDPRNTGKAMDASGNGNHGTINGAKYVSGLVGADRSSTDTGYLATQNFAAHSGIFIEEGTTNLITNPSFENETSATLNWGKNYFNYATAAATFAPAMAKRNSSGPFAQGVIVQGDWDASDIKDELSFSPGNSISGYFYQNVDSYQGSIVFWLTPEWNGNDGKHHELVSANTSRIAIWKGSDNYLYFQHGGQNHKINIDDWLAGTTYSIVLRWDTKSTLDDAHYFDISVDNVQNFGNISSGGAPGSFGMIGIGNKADKTPPNADAIIEGLTVYRRPLWDGEYGINVGNGDEIEQIWNNGSGKDPTLVTGSWDVVFALPTNASSGSISTGTGNAWSHPYVSNVLYTDSSNTGGFMMGVDYVEDGWSQVSPWWLEGEVSSENVVAVYQPKGANSYTDSKTNLANPSTYTISDGLDPNWNTTDGWIFTGTHYLETGITHDDSGQSWSMIASFSDVSNSNSVVVSDSNGTGQRTTGFSLIPRWLSGGVTQVHTYVNSGTSTVSDFLTEGVMAVAGSQGYLNGTPDGGSIPTGTQYENEIHIGSFTDDVPFFSGKIKALAIYDTTLTAEQVSSVNTAISDYDAIYVKSLDASEKIFAGGYKWTNNAANQGIKYIKSSLTAGQNYVVRALAHSDTTSIPKVQIWDATNDHEITQLTGTNTSTRTAPNVLNFTFELPTVARYNPVDDDLSYDWVDADCTSIEVRLINTEASGTVYWHQIELLANMFDNPSFEIWEGTPSMPVKWTAGSSDEGEITKDSENYYSGNSAIVCTEGFDEENLFYDASNFFTTANSFYSYGAHISGNSSNSIALSSNNAGSRVRLQASNGSLASFLYTLSSSWDLVSGVVRTSSEAFGNTPYLKGNGIVSKIDDIYAFKLTDIPLTVTPASQANSTENTGLRVDGADTLTQDINNQLSNANGVIKFKFTPRHSFDTSDMFGSTAPEIIHLSTNEDADDYIKLYRYDDSTLRLAASFAGNVVNADWTDPPVLNAGTTYNLEISYSAGGYLKLLVNGTEEASTAIDKTYAFGTVPATVYFGSNNSGSNQYDCTITNFTALTPSENTIAPYYTFGSKSVKLIGYDKPDEYTIAATASANGSYTLSTYVYDGTTSNVAGVVDTSVAQLASGSAALSTTYTDMGGGWWRLTHTTGTIPANTYYFGVQVQPGRTIYIDGVQLEAKSYATTYADGSLGTGYSWSETAHESLSIRNATNILVPRNGNLNSTPAAISMWFKPVSMKTSGVHFLYDGTFACGCPSLQFSATGYGIGQDSSWGRTVSTTITKDKWYHVVAMWDGSNMGYLYSNGIGYSFTPAGAAWAFNCASLTIGANDGGNSSHANAVISDVRIFDKILTAGEVTDLYYQGLSTHSSGSESDDRYEDGAMTYTSPVIDLSANGQWGASAWQSQATTPEGTSISYYTKTSADNNIWSDWAAVSGNTIASDPRRYFQWKADLSANEELNESPVISGMTVSYVEDTTAPQNPESVALGYATSSTSSASLTSGTWYNYDSPMFTWDVGADDAGEGQSASGIASYYALLTQDETATPSAHIADDCFSQTSADSRAYIVGTAPSNCVLSDGTYYLRLQTKDNSGNISGPVTSFIYKYDGSIPNAPANVSTTNVGYSATNSFTFYWPAATDNGPSGISGYEYKTGTSSGTLSDWIFTVDTTATAITAYQEGQNFFYVRAKDNAANYSGTTTNNVAVGSFYYNASAPTKPENVVLSPATSESAPSISNVFDVTWDKPATYSGDIAKYYYCVNCTPSQTTMTETTPEETITRTLESLALATQQGKNTFYIVAEDNNVNATTGHGNRNFDAYESADFYASTVAPGAPVSLTISDTSDRDSSIWRLTLAWKVPATGGTPDHYDMYRSTDNTSFAKIGSTTSTAYTDADLTSKQLYYYKVYAIDNAGSVSIASNTVSKSPEGKYTSPPTTGGIPSVATGATTATISWLTGRAAFGSVEYGKTSAFGAIASEASSSATHSVKIAGLSPGTTYYFRVQNLDTSDLVGYTRDEAYSSSYSFTTLTTPSISGISATDITLNSAYISWNTTSMSSAVVEYGESTAYGSSITVSTTADESTHSARLSNLKDSTTYHFRVRGTTSDADDIFSQDNEFTTLTFPKVTALVMNTDQEAGGTSVLLAWSTNVPTTGEIQYQAVSLDTANTKSIPISAIQKMSQTELAAIPVIPKGALQTAYSGKLETKHLQRITGLSDGTIYVFTIRGRDANGNEAISDPIRYATGLDSRAPTLQNIIIETPITGVGADAKAQIIVSWETDEPAIGQVMWGAGTGSEYPNATEKDSAFTTRHVVVIRDLQPTQSYHLKIISADKSKNTAESKDTVVVTPTAQQAAFDIILKNLEDVFGFLKL
ncbi:MAG: LamG-like jellyroll fold domain-containing protein [Patescibacteria group bacterium]